MTKPAQRKRPSGDRRYKHRPAAATPLKRNKQKGFSEVAVIPREELEPHIDEMRLKHPLVTDFQAEIVRLVIHKGWNASQCARHMGVDAQRCRYHMEKSHVCSYRQELAMQALGWDAIFAQSTLVSLLKSKSDYVRLEAAKDLADRAGLSMERQRAGAVAVQLNFGIAGVSPAPTQPILAGSGRASGEDEQQDEQ